LDEGVRAFFGDLAARDAARAALASQYSVAAVDVSDEDWARRSQEHLPPVTVGRITIVSHPTIQPPAAGPQPALSSVPPLRLVIQPSMGFGTGHHATTRLCLEALQHVDLEGRRVLDVGTGSGVLAIAAARLGAAEVLGVDVDPDAIQNARDNLALNGNPEGVRFEIGDFRQADLTPAHVVMANLTGAMLSQNAERLLALVRGGGTLIVSGLQSH